MLTFITQFYICNIYIAIFIIVLFVLKFIFKNFLSPRTQYKLWFILFFLLTVPFLPTQVHSPTSLLCAMLDAYNQTITSTGSSDNLHSFNESVSSLTVINDYAVSVSSKAPSTFSFCLLIIWILGMFVLTLRLFRSWKQLHNIEYSSSPIHNTKMQTIFNNCLSELKIRKKIPLYSTIDLNSPAITGILRPRIYIPAYLINEENSSNLRYILLHELQHYCHKDGIVNMLMNLFSIVYWFNPLVWFAFKKMKNDGEIACDSSVLLLLEEKDYVDYGSTLLNFAEKLSSLSSPLASGISGDMKQMKRRILNIATFRQTSGLMKIRNISIYLFISIIILNFAPVLSTSAITTDYYAFDKNNKSVTYLNLSSDFAQYNGSFVLYDETTANWILYNETLATTRISPNSTYKIYDALMGLENEIITSEDSLLSWNGEDYSFDAWETDQDLNSAMQNSVNWYFQTLDSSAGRDTIHSFLQEVNYGNQTIGPDLSTYWTDSSLKISPIEQVELLQKFYSNDFHFSEKNIDTVKNAIHLSTTESYSLFGKTGTGRVDGEDVNGWFIGFIETQDNIYYFALNIQGNSNVTGSKASEIALSILEDMGIFNE